MSRNCIEIAISIRTNVYSKFIHCIMITARVFTIFVHQYCRKNCDEMDSVLYFCDNVMLFL